MASTESGLLNKRMQTLLDKEDIREVIARFCRGSDRRIRDIVQSVYHPGATDNHGFYNGAADKFYDTMALAPPVDCSYHLLGQTLIKLNDENTSAWAETYCTATTIKDVNGKEGEDGWVTFLVRYVDGLEKKEGEWRILNRTVVYDACSDKAIWKQLPKSSLGTTDENDLSRKVFQD